MTGRRLRANASAWCTALAAAFAFVPFLPRLVRAAFTGGRDRERTLASMRAGLSTRPSGAPSVAAGAPRVLIVAGEPSGDLHAADLAAAILRAAPGASIEGIGGPRMAAAGVRVTTDLVSDPVMGVWPVVRRAPRFFALYRDLLLRFEEDPPDVVVGVDYPGLNLRLARAARRRGVPFVEYIAPQVWAWAPWRTRKLARDVARVVCILPFEEGIFRAAGTQACYVGHPLFEHLAKAPRDDAFRARLREGLGGAPLIALLPGSRRAEVRGNLPVQIDAARRIAAAQPGTRFVVPLAAERLRPLVEATDRSGLDVVLVPPERSDDAMAAADAAISVSGTATLHLAAHGTPAVVIYRASAMGRALARVLVVSPFIALPNLLCAQRVLPEFLVGAGDGPKVADALLPLLPGGGGREEALAALADLRERMTSPGVADRAARWVLASARTT